MHGMIVEYHRRTWYFVDTSSYSRIGMWVVLNRKYEIEIYMQI